MLAADRRDGSNRILCVQSGDFTAFILSQPRSLKATFVRKLDRVGAGERRKIGK